MVVQPIFAGASYSIQDLGNLGRPSAGATDINELGQVIGWSQTLSWETHAFLWENGIVTDLGTLPGAFESSALGINNRGQIVGRSLDEESNPHAILWTR